MREYDDIISVTACRIFQKKPMMPKPIKCEPPLPNPVNYMHIYADV